MFKRIIMLLVVVALPVALSAQESPLSIVAKVLSLSDAQTQALGNLMQTRAEAIRPLAEQAQARQQTLAQQLQSSDPDPQTVGGLVIEITHIQQQIQQAVMATNQQFAMVLTPDQSARLEQIRSVAPVCDVIPAFKAVGLL
jgi:Spy/CpxP family protein refolding chaperone